VRSATETCDGADVGTETCVSQGFASGTLGCQAGCGAFDTSSCLPPICGNGVKEGAEECDDSNAMSGDGCSMACAVESISEVEPNDDGAVSTGSSLRDGNDFSAAAADGPYSADVILSASFGVPGDEDVFALTNPTAAPSTVRLETFSATDFGNCTSSTDTVINLRDAAGVLIEQDDDDGISLCSLIEVVLAPGETAYAHLVDYGDDGTYPYYLRVDFL
jgi:cysteine-rich repeat protein